MSMCRLWVAVFDLNIVAAVTELLKKQWHLGKERSQSQASRPEVSNQGNASGVAQQMLCRRRVNLLKPSSEEVSPTHRRGQVGLRRGATCRDGMELAM